MSGFDVARGPLVVSTANPRYFTVASDERKAVYLTGSHIWNNLHDGMGPGLECAETPERLDFAEYLDFLEGHKNLGSGPVTRSSSSCSTCCASAATKGDPDCPSSETPVS